jgi:rod shape determining protein RodA
VAINKKMIKNFDFSILFNVLCICAIGIATIASATGVFAGGSKRNFIMQIVWTIIGVILLLITVFIDYSTFKAYYKVLYIINLGMLVAVSALNKVTNGASSWFGIGSFGVQPSEFMKITLIIVVAKKIEEFDGDINNIKNIGILLLYSIPPLILIYKEPDLGTTLIIIFIIVGMVFMAGLDLRVFFGGIGVAIASIFAIFPFLETHQQDRIKVFLDPSLDPLGAAYHINQSMIAIGSGQLWGMGYGKGLQSEGKFLPEPHTDFIFSVLGEEFGFIGALILVLLYISFILKCFKVTKIAKDKFGEMLVTGITAMFLFQAFENIGMTIGLMPITGITLPFVSYGGSSMLTSMVATGLVLNVGMRRHKINF